MRLLTLDLETTIKESYKRKANPFDPANDIVAWGLGYSNSEPETYYMEDPPEDWLDDVGMIIGHNLKFDLLYLWGRPDFKQWLKNGGKIFDTQMAEYLLSGQKHLFPSLDDCSRKYGGQLKNDEIKEFWENGICTKDIPKDMLLEYLEWDIKNTRTVYKGQIAKIKKLGMINTIHTHMEGLLAVVEMEYNGMYVDVKKAEEQTKQLEKDLETVKAKLEQYIPRNLPEEITWNWASKDHLSALFFGGKIKYKKQVHQKDDDGNLLYTKKKEPWYLINGEPIHPQEVEDYDALDRFKSGKKMGQLKTKNVDVQGDPKLKYKDFFFEIPKMTDPDPDWETKKEGVYKTDDNVLKELEDGVPAAKLMREWRKLDKDLGTYYKRYDPKKKDYVGMLTLVQSDGIIHHTLHTASTVTGRLSSSNPNLQNTSGEDKSKVKSIFSSRWKGGKLCQVDFSQLEVVIKAFLSQDKAMIQDIKDNVDFHSKRLAFKLGEDYEDVLRKVKVEKDPEYLLMRKKAKPVSFQKAYGASVKGVARQLKMEESEVQAFFDAEDEAYPEAAAFDDKVREIVEASRVPTDKQEEVDGVKVTIGKGIYVAPTGKRYVFEEVIAPPSMRKGWKGRPPKYTNFMSTQMKNYQIQGGAGEIVYLTLGKVFREFLARDNFGGKALLTNMVHDSIIADMENAEVAMEAGQLIKDCCERVPEYYKERYGLECNVPFRADFELGDNWLSLKEVE